MKLHNLAQYEENLATEPWQGKQSAVEQQEYEAYWDMNEGYKSEIDTSSLVNKPWWIKDTKGKGKLY